MQCQTVPETQRKGKARDLEKNRESKDKTAKNCVGGSESKNDPPWICGGAKLLSGVT